MLVFFFFLKKNTIFCLLFANFLLFFSLYFKVNCFVLLLRTFFFLLQFTSYFCFLISISINSIWFYSFNFSLLTNKCLYLNLLLYFTIKVLIIILINYKYKSDWKRDYKNLDCSLLAYLKIQTKLTFSINCLSWK